MKKFFLAATILLCLICAGCLQGKADVIITADGKVFLSHKLVSIPLLSRNVEEWKNSFANSRPDIEIKHITESNMSGYKIDMEYPNIEKFAKDNLTMFMTYPGKGKGILKRGGWFFDSYCFDLFLKGKASDYSPESAATAQAVLSQVIFDLVIELPYSAETTNADRVENENKTLTWHLASSLTVGDDRHMRAQFKIWHREKIFLTALVELLLLAATIFFFVKARSKDLELAAKDLTFKRNVFAGLSVALAIISAYMLLAPITFTDADIISAIAP